MNTFNLFRVLCGAALVALVVLSARAQDETPPAPLPQGADALVADFNKAIQDIERKTVAAKYEARLKMETRMEERIKAATRKGDLDGALALKKAMTECAEKAPVAAETLILTEEKEALLAFARLEKAGKCSFSYAYPNGQSGTLVINKKEAIDVPPSIQGVVTYSKGSAVIKWANNTSWQLFTKSGELWVRSSAGDSKLTGM